MALNHLYRIDYRYDCESLDFVDLTVYGAPNADRANLAIYLFVTRMFEDPEEDTDVSPSNDTPVTSTQWNVLTADDGYYEFQVLAVNVWDVATVYDTDDLVYRNGSVYKGLSDGITAGTDPEVSPGLWEFVPDLTAEADNDTLEISVIAGEIVDARVRKCHKTELVNDECICSNCDEYSVPLHTKIYNLLNAAQARLLNEQPIEAEKIIRTATDLCEGIVDD